MNSNRIVLFPYGQPAEGKRDACIALLIKAGGDLNRFLDGPWGDDPSSLRAESQFLRCVARLNEVVSGSQPPFILLARTNPLPLAVQAKRRRLCEALPNLNRALWILFVVPTENPFFARNAAQLGTFDVDAYEPARFTVWTPADQRAADGERYVVWTPETRIDDSFKTGLISALGEASKNPIEPVTLTRLRSLQFPDEPLSASRRRY